MARATTIVQKVNDAFPLYGAQEVLGTPVIPATRWDPVTGGEVYLRPNTQTDRFVGARVYRRGGIIRAGIDNLEFRPRNATLLKMAVRGSSSDPAGEWAYDGQVQANTIYAGSTQECVQLDWAKINTLELTQEYPADGDDLPLTATANIVAATGVVSTTGLTKQEAETLPTLQGWQSEVTLSGIAAGARIRRWRLYINNNISYMTYGDISSANRYASELREGEEEVEFELDVEIPVSWAAAANNDYNAVCYTPGPISGTIVYTNNCTGGSPQTTTLMLSNLVLAEDQGFSEPYEAEGADREPVKVFTFKFVKNDPTLVSFYAVTD